MAIFSFFNEKGGAGKSLHSLLFGSYLAHNKGLKVCLVDFEPLPRLVPQREDEDKLLEDTGSFLSRYLASHPQAGGVLDIVSAPSDLRQKGDRSTEDFRAALDAYVNGLAEEYEYVIVDLPAEIRPEGVSFNFLFSCVDLVAVPFDCTPSVMRCAYNTVYTLSNMNIPVVMFWNKVSATDFKNPKYLDDLEEFFTGKSYDVLPHRIKFFKKAMRESDTMMFVVSTYCWPGRYIELTCPQLELLYASLKERLDQYTV